MKYKIDNINLFYPRCMRVSPSTYAKISWLCDLKCNSSELKQQIAKVMLNSIYGKPSK